MGFLPAEQLEIFKEGLAPWDLFALFQLEFREADTGRC
jgi:hypothetical protein